MSKLDKVVKRMQSQQDEVLEAMEARKGDKGKVYVAIVKEAAASLAVIRASAMQLPEFHDPLQHAASCTIAFGMHKVLDLYKTNDEALLDDFRTDILAITQFMLHKCTEDELDS